MGKTTATATAAQIKQEEAAIETFNGFQVPGNTPLIYQIIGKAMGEVDAIGKNSTAQDYNGKVKFNFRGIDDVYNALNPVMSKYGLFIVPEVLEQTREDRLTSNNKPVIYTILKVKFTMYAPDGSFVQSIIVGEGADSGDKSANKAMSIAMKYFCFQVFMIPTEEMKADDADRDVHELERQNRGQNQQNQQAPKQNQQPKQNTPPAAQNSQQQAPQTANRGTVTTAQTLPKTEAQQVDEYIRGEIAFMSQMMEISDEATMLKTFADWKQTLIDGKVPGVENKKTKDMNMKEAKALVDAIYKNFLSDKKEDQAS